MMSTSRRLVTIASAVSTLAIGAPVAGAYADGPEPPAPAPLSLASLPINSQLLGKMPALQFNPPKIGQIAVAIGPTIIGGKVINPGLHVVSPPVTLPPIGTGAGAP
jgi:hypothetical protein